MSFQEEFIALLQGHKIGMTTYIYGSNSAVPAGLGLLFHHPTLERAGYSRSSLRERIPRNICSRLEPMNRPLTRPGGHPLTRRGGEGWGEGVRFMESGFGKR